MGTCCEPPILNPVWLEGSWSAQRTDRVPPPASEPPCSQDHTLLALAHSGLH